VSNTSPTGYATDGGFPFQMRALSELFDETTLLLPLAKHTISSGTMPLTGHNLSIRPLTLPVGQGWLRKLGFSWWLIRNGISVCLAIWRAGGVHVPIPGDVGTIGLVIALLLRKPLFIRHCGNWNRPKTNAEWVWRWIMERFAGGKNVFMATGGGPEPPSTRNRNIKWIFSTSLSSEDLVACQLTHRRTPSSNLRIVTVGRQEPSKNTHLIIESLPLIQRSFHRLTLDIVGDGSAIRTLHAFSHDLGQHENVVFHGRIEHREVLQIMKSADIFCFPSEREGFPKAVLEAMACGLPVVTSQVSVLPQLASTCGIILAESTPEELARAVVTICTNPTLYVAMSAAAIEAASHYSLEAWSSTIGARLTEQWGQLRNNE